MCIRAFPATGTPTSSSCSGKDVVVGTTKSVLINIHVDEDYREFCAYFVHTSWKHQVVGLESTRQRSVYDVDNIVVSPHLYQSSGEEGAGVAIIH